MGEEHDIETTVAPAQVGGDVFNVYVVDLQAAADRHPSWHVHAEDPGKDTAHEVSALLEDWVTKVAAKASVGATAKVHWGTSLPDAIKPKELYVYLTTTARSKHGAAVAERSASTGHSGATQLKKHPKLGMAVLCEVWPKKIPQSVSLSGFNVILAKLIFHEWLHFKLDVDVDDDVVHELGNFGEPVLDNQPPHEPSAAVIDPMAAALSKEFKFYK